MRRNDHSYNNKNFDGGVTLVELIVVIAIMTTLVGLTVPQFVRYISE